VCRGAGLKLRAPFLNEGLHKRTTEQSKNGILRMTLLRQQKRSPRDARATTRGATDSADKDSLSQKRCQAQLFEKIDLIEKLHGRSTYSAKQACLSSAFNELQLSLTARHTYHMSVILTMGPLP
jgi:ATP-dependent phosphoenolpyruvate carboxykinase